jgi:hypothetical protein
MVLILHARTDDLRHCLVLRFAMVPIERGHKMKHSPRSQAPPAGRSQRLETLSNPRQLSLAESASPNGREEMRNYIYRAEE